MEIRQQVTLGPNDINEVIIEYLKRKGLRVKASTITNDRNVGFFCLLMTEDEIYFADTQVLVSKPFSLLELKNQKLKEKLNKIFFTGTIGNLLSLKLPSAQSQTDLLKEFKTNNFLNELLYTTSFSEDPEVEEGITDTEEKLLIKTFGDLGIKVNKKPKN
jgi:hypothetical protein